MITKKLIYGGVGDEFCVLGPSGVKIGSHYLIFIRNNEYIDGGGCSIVGDIGGRIPYALEIIKRRRVRADSGLVSGYRSEINYVWINSENIFYPYLGREALLRNSSIHAGSEQGGVDLGLIVPLDRMIDYLIPTAADHDDIDYEATAEPYVIFESVAGGGDVVASVYITEAYAGDSNGGKERVFYKVRSLDNSGGDGLDESCIEGGGGLKVGVPYLVVIDSSRKNEMSNLDCGEGWGFAGYILGSFEVVGYGVKRGFGGFSSSKYVRLDDRRVLYPHFKDAIDASVIRFDSHGRGNAKGVAKLVLFENFVEYLSDVRNLN